MTTGKHFVRIVKATILHPRVDLDVVSTVDSSTVISKNNLIVPVFLMGQSFERPKKILYFVPILGEEGLVRSLDRSFHWVVSHSYGNDINWTIKVRNQRGSFRLHIIRSVLGLTEVPTFIKQGMSFIGKGTEGLVTVDEN